MRTFLEFVEAISLEKAGSIKAIIDNNGLVMFFKVGKDYFGATEESRVVFARMKNPSHDDPSAWRKEAGFTALNLSKAVKGEKTEQMFEFKDLKSIAIVEKDDVIKTLEKSSGKGINKFPVVIDLGGDDNIPANMDSIEDDK